MSNTDWLIFVKLVHWMRGGDQLTHFVIRVQQNLLPHIASFLKKDYIMVMIVLDPFSGSGTVALRRIN